MALTVKQKRFVEEYLVDLCAAKAAVRAGFSERTAREQGHQLLGRPDVADAIEKAVKERSERTKVEASRVVQELACMAFYDPADIAGAKVEEPADIAKLPEAVRRAVIGWSWDAKGNFVLKLAPKTPNLDLLGKHLGMFKERVEHTGANGGPIETREYSDLEKAKAIAALFARVAAQREETSGRL